MLQVNYILKSFVSVDSNDWLKMLDILVNPKNILNEQHIVIIQINVLILPLKFLHLETFIDLNKLFLKS